MATCKRVLLAAAVLTLLSPAVRAEAPSTMNDLADWLRMMHGGDGPSLRDSYGRPIDVQIVQAADQIADSVVMDFWIGSGHLRGVVRSLAIVRDEGAALTAADANFYILDGWDDLAALPGVARFPDLLAEIAAARDTGGNFTVILKRTAADGRPILYAFFEAGEASLPDPSCIANTMLAALVRPLTEDDIPAIQDFNCYF